MTVRVELYPDDEKEGASLLLWESDMAMQFFKSPEDLPQWVKERIAVIQIMGKGKRIMGVGEQVLADVYYINEPDELEYPLTLKYPLTGEA